MDLQKVEDSSAYKKYLKLKEDDVFKVKNRFLYYGSVKIDIWSRPKYIQNRITKLGIKGELKDRIEDAVSLYHDKLIQLQDLRIKAFGLVAWDRD